MIRAIVFDMFGVIRPDVLLAAYQKFGGDTERDAQFIHDTILATNRGIIPSSRPVLAEHLGISVDAWSQALDDHDGNDKELLAFIQTLRPKYKVGLLSNVGKGRLADLFEPGQMGMLFDVAIGSGDIGFAKPEARAYEIVADRLGVRADECIFTDDREDYCEGARAVGMQTILYKQFTQFRVELEKLLAHDRH